MMMTDVSEESLLDYFYSVGGNSGKVKNADLLKTYKPFIGHSDPQLRAKYREEFKLIIDRIASVKSENGEKYLVLKKKYRQLLQDRDTEHGGTNGDRQRHSSPARMPGTAQWEGPVTSSPCCPKKDVRVVPSASTAGPAERGSGQVMCCGGPSITVTEAADHTESQEDQLSLTIQSTQEAPVQIEEPMAHSNAEDDIDKDSVSKSESEQDEEGMGSIGSPAVALDPIEKEWIYSAAGARVPTLSELLRQDPSLANKKDFTSTALHWAAKHGKEDMATLVANAGADVNTKSGYTPLHIAALHGHRHILDLLRTYGANEKLRDYSGRLACHYLNITGGPEEDSEMQFQVTQATEARERSRNRKLTSLFQSKKKWGSAEELAPIEEERSAPQQLMLPAYRSRKFSR